MILADHGARVISIEDRRYLKENFLLTSVNRNKQHMTLNLKTAEGRSIFYRLVKKADVVIEGFRPGVVKRLGVDYDTVNEINPAIIYCAISGYGQYGSMKDKAGHDVNYLAYSGVLELIGLPDRPPAIPGIQIADLAGGGLNAAIGILLALLARERTGKGQYIDISMTDGSVSLLSLLLHFLQKNGEAPRRADMRFSHRYACYNTYETKDGRFLSIGAVEKKFWDRLCKLLNVPEYSHLQYDDHRREEIIDFMRRTFKTKTLLQWEKQLDDVDACWASVKTLKEVLTEKYYREREMVVDLDDRKGNLTTHFGTPIKLSQTPGGVRTPSPNFGADTRDILSELGHSNKEIDLMVERGIV
jgi:crotonobetainyl-CoA:carnitine CoA-transferase CaiB-like acyl-CoA transferase